MGYFDDDFYNEPSEFEQQVDEFKQALIKSVKQEFVDKMERLRKENDELKVFKSQKQEFERQHNHALSDLQRRASEAEQKAKHARLRELLGENLTVAWGVKDDYEELPKCDKCDKDRKIHFNAPSGKELTEACECGHKKHNFVPQELSLVRFYMMGEKRDYDEERIEKHYRKVDKIESDYDEYRDTTSVYRGEAFDKASRYGIVFLEKAKCEEYCDWLNTKDK